MTPTKTNEGVVIAAEGLDLVTIFSGPDGNANARQALNYLVSVNMAVVTGAETPTITFNDPGNQTVVRVRMDTDADGNRSNPFYNPIT